MEERLGPVRGRAEGGGASCIVQRQVWMYLCREAGWSLTEIGQELKMHHTTVLSSHRKIQAARAADPQMDRMLSEMAESAALGAAATQVEKREARISPHRIVRIHPEDMDRLADLVVARLHQRGAA